MIEKEILEFFKKKGWALYMHEMMDATDKTVENAILMGKEEQQIFHDCHYLVLPDIADHRNPKAIEDAIALSQAPPTYMMFRGKPIPGKAKIEGFYLIDSIVYKNGLNIVLDGRAFRGLPPEGQNIFIEPQNIEKAIHYSINRYRVI